MYISFVIVKLVKAVLFFAILGMGPLSSSWNNTQKNPHIY